MSERITYGVEPLDRDKWQRAFQVLTNEFEDRTGNLFAYCDFENETFAVHMYRDCDCPVDDDLDDDREVHAADCPPNFWHKRSGLRVCWYKYPFRASCSNQEVSDAELETVVGECLLSLFRLRDAGAGASP